MGKGTLLLDYIELYKEYSKQYEQCVVVLQKGEFYELYGIDVGDTVIKLDEIAKVLDYRLTVVDSRCDRKLWGTLECPRMIGIPVVSAERKFSQLTSNNYVIVVVTESSERKPDGTAVRKVTRIVTPSTNIVDNYSTVSHAVALTVQSEGKHLVTIGICSIEMFTGKVSIYETYNSVNDISIAIDDVTKFLILTPPRELYVYNDTRSESHTDLLVRSLDMSNETLIHKRTVTDTMKLSVIEQCIKMVYNEHIADQFCVRNDLLIALSSFVRLIEKINTQNTVLVSKLQPITMIRTSNEHGVVSLDSNSALQLNVTTAESNYGKKRSTLSLLALLDKCSTDMGKRLLRSRLLMPSTNTALLLRRYNRIEQFIKMSLAVQSVGVYSSVIELLNSAVDIEKCMRRIDISGIEPMHLYGVYNTLTQCNSINVSDLDLNIPDNDRKVVTDALETIKVAYDLTVMAELSLSTSTSTEILRLPNRNINDELDVLIDTVKKYTDLLNTEVTKLCTIAPVKLKCNSGEYSIVTTVTRSALIKKHSDDYTFIKGTRTEVTVSSKSIDEITTQLQIYTTKTIETIKQDFYKRTQQFSLVVIDSIQSYINFIAELDFAHSAMLTALKYNYSKPKCGYGTAYVTFKQLRNPIVEHLIDTPYIANDVALGSASVALGSASVALGSTPEVERTVSAPEVERTVSAPDVVIINACNGVGKSVLMKAVALNVIMAQAGLYVSAESMEFNPFTKIMTRITGNDNMYRGQSSFIVETTELRSIVYRADINTLVVADEICRGTEHCSAVALVASTVQLLAKRNVKFITASHLNDLMRIQFPPNVQFKHMRITFERNDANVIAVMDRKVYDNANGTNEPYGTTPSAYYGVEVAETVIHDKEFIDNAYKYRNEFFNKVSYASPKVSKWNSSLLMISCSVCGSDTSLETHHIIEQCTADAYDYVINRNGVRIHKNLLCNLVVLCAGCHDLHHNGTINISGWENEQYGTTLQYSTSTLKTLKQTKEVTPVATPDANTVVRELIKKCIGKMSVAKIQETLKTEGHTLTVYRIKRIIADTHCTNTSV